MSAGKLPAKPNLPVEDGPEHAEPGVTTPAPIDARFEIAETRGDSGRPMRAPPILGTLAVIFGVTALYKATLFLAPIALALGIIAVFRRQAGWGLIGMGAAFVALVIDPAFWGLVGLAWLLDRYGWLLPYAG